MTMTVGVTDFDISVIGSINRYPMILRLTLALSIICRSSGSHMIYTSELSESDIEPKRVRDVLFNNSTNISGRNVRCSQTSNQHYVFPSETWSCYNLKVDEQRMRAVVSSGTGRQQCSEDLEGRNDIGALCRQLLIAHGIKRPLHSAFIINDATCNYNSTNRLQFLKSNNTFIWQTFRKIVRGYLKSIRCTIADSSTGQ